MGNGIAVSRAFDVFKSSIPQNCGDFVEKLDRSYGKKKQGRGPASFCL
jgi:hypothetical protein